MTPTEIIEAKNYLKRLAMPDPLRPVFELLCEMQVVDTRKLSDHDVGMILALHASGVGYARIAHKFEVSKSYVAKLCRGKRRVH